MAAPVLYLLDDSGEAHDVRYFCSEACREAFSPEFGDSTAKGNSADWIEETVCDQCGKPLIASPTNEQENK